MEHVGFHLPGEGKLLEDGMDVPKQSLEKRTKNLCTEHSTAYCTACSAICHKGQFLSEICAFCLVTLGSFALSLIYVLCDKCSKFDFYRFTLRLLQVCWEHMPLVKRLL